MKLLADKDERFKGLFRKIAIFVSLAMVGLALNLIYSGIKKGFFTPQSSIHFIAQSGQDIKEGMPVKLSGFKIGTVKSIALNNMAQAQVEMAIDNQYLPLLNADAVVSLKKEGIIGDSILEARRGTEEKKPLQPGDKIRFERTGGLEQIAQDLRDRLFPALDEINKLLHDANDPQGDVRQTMKNLREFSSEMRGTQARLDRLMQQAELGMTTDVRPALHNMRQSAEHIGAMVDKLDQETPLLLNKINTTLDNLQRSTQTIDAAVTQTAPQLPGLVGESRSLVGDTRNILDAASSSWPLNKMIPPPDKGLLKMDSHD